MTPTFRHGKPTIGVLAGWQFYRTATSLSYLVPVFRGISRAAQDLGCNLLLGCGMGPSASPDDPFRPAWPSLSSEADFVPIGPQNTDGLIVTSPLHSHHRSEYIQSLIAAGHPVLFIGSGEPGPTIVADNTGSIREAMRHLVEHGHRQIAFIAGSQEDMDGDSGDRLRAYQAAVKAHRLKSDTRLVEYGRHVFDGGYSAIQKIMDSGVSFTALLASNDESAIGAMQALKEAGRRIPQDVAVIGFDNRAEDAVQEPALSSIHVPLFNVGYRAVDLLLKGIESGRPLSGKVKVETRLVARESCGCSPTKIPPASSREAATGSPASNGEKRAGLAQTITAAVMSQAQGLTEDECQYYCKRLVATFNDSLRHGDVSGFQKTLEEVLLRTVSGDDDAHIWQEAISLLAAESKAAPRTEPASLTLLNEMLDRARFTVSAQMERQHRQYVVDQRWTNSRLSLLTARLQTALEEDQIYTVLAQHLPDMGIRVAMLAHFEADGDDPAAFSVIRNLITPSQGDIRFPSCKFPPDGLFGRDELFHLTLIPIVGPSGQSGFAVFGTEFLDLYGAIVQQLAGALNTSRLYRQATEGRRLAEEANLMKSRFLSTISHELRTPLNLIVNLSGIVLQESDESDALLPESYRRDIERIQAYAQHLGGLIGDVLDLATSQAGRLRLYKEFVNLGQALRLVAESGYQLAADKGLQWQASLPESGPWVWCDPTRLRQIVLNLINNAVKFTPHGEIQLHVETGSETVTVMVTDTGLGIPPQEQQTIFDEFHRSERSIAQGYPGLGLGLAICKRLVEVQGGTIGVRSSGKEGDGSTFFFALPTVPPPAEQVQGPARMPAAEQSVLMLTNRPGTGERLRDHLDRQGIKIQEAQIDRASDWQLRLAASPPDAIILDVTDAPEQGWEALRAIKDRQVQQGIPVLFYTASQEGESLLQLDYLTKPIELTELKRALDQYWLMAESPGPVRTFLVVDDEPNTLELQARIVQSHSSSNRVLKARNGREALEVLHREAVDLVLLDLQMPEMDGFEVLEAMRAEASTRGIPVIVVTGRTLTETDMLRLNRGVAVVLEKGLFSLDETVNHIHAALERKRRISAEAQRLVRNAMAYLHEHFADTLSRREIAQHVGITEDYLTFCFRQELGTTPIEYLQRYRVNRAKQLLKEGQQTVTEIALAVGFSDSGYFSRIFRRETGVSPEVFRRS